MKKVSLHVVGVLTAVFIIFILGLFVGRQQIPKETIPSQTYPNMGAPTENALEKVNINTASFDELCNLPGVGPATANAIIDYRTANGPFESVEQLIDVKGIGYKKFEELVELICFD